MRRLCFFILSFFAVFTGHLIYLGWRDGMPSWGLVWAHYSLMYFLKESLGAIIHLPNWVIYSLPQGLWAFGLSMFVGGIWYDGPQSGGYFWLFVSWMAVVLWEIFQMLGYISGTFCWIDVVVGICGVGLGIILFTFKKLKS
jgi:hypothetical protein